MAEAIYRPRNWNIAEWSESHIRLPGSPPLGSHVNWSLTPWSIEPLRAFADVQTEKIVLMASAQTSKTLQLIAMACWAISEDPSNTIICLHTEQAAKDFAQLRFNEIIKATSPVADILPDFSKGGTGIRGTARSMNKVMVSNGSWIQIIPANRSSLRSHSSRRLLLDEVAMYNAGILADAEARAALYPTRKIVIASTPLYAGEGNPGADFHDAYLQGTQESWHLGCLHCEDLIPLDFRKVIQWSPDAQKHELEYDMDLVKQTTRLVCPSCKGVHENTAEVVDRMNQRGRYVVGNPSADKRIRSFHFNRIAMKPPISWWSNMATEFLSAHIEARFGDPSRLKGFINLSLGEPFRLDEGEDVREIITCDEALPEIDSPFLRVAGADRQKDHLWMIVRDYKPNGDSILRMAGRVDDEVEMASVLEKWNVRPKNTVIDVRFAKHEVQKFCAEYGWIGYAGYTGVGESAITKRYLWSKTLPSGHIQKVYKHYSEIKIASIGRRKGMKPPKYFEANSNEAGTILARVRDGKFRPVSPKFEVPKPALGDWADEYISQLNAVRMVPKVSTDGRRYYTLFNLRTSDHLFDCEKMAMTLAIRRGVVLGDLPKKEK